MKKITQEQYFALNNKILTRSKIMDYLKCPNYFYRKHITGEVAQPKDSDAFKVGGAVDDLLAQLEVSRDIVVFEGDRRTKDGKAEYAALLDDGKTVVSATQYNQIINIADAVEKTSAYKILSCFEKQRVLSVPLESKSGHVTMLAGLPDFIKVDDRLKLVTIVDLKTSCVIDARRYHFHSIDYGYYMQAALYTKLAKEMYPGYEVEFFHLVAEKTEPYRVKVFLLGQQEINKHIEKLNETIKEICNDTEFARADASFDDCDILGELSYESNIDVAGIWGSSDAETNSKND